MRIELVPVWIDLFLALTAQCKKTVPYIYSPLTYVCQSVSELFALAALLSFDGVLFGVCASGDLVARSAVRPLPCGSHACGHAAADEQKGSCEL